MSKLKVFLSLVMVVIMLFTLMTTLIACNGSVGENTKTDNVVSDTHEPSTTDNPNDDNDDDVDNNNGSDNDNSTIFEKSERPNKIYTYDEVVKMYEGKTVLVYLSTDAPHSDVIDEINRYLIETDADYVVHFLQLPDITNGQYIEEVSGYIEASKPVDIIYSGISPKYVNTYFDYFIQKGYIIPFDDYFKTDKGQRLYDSLPQCIWESIKRNNKIYGVNGYCWAISAPPGYAVNKSLMDQYGLTIADLSKPLPEISSIFDMIANSGIVNKKFAVISSNISYTAPHTTKVTDAVYLDEKSERLSAGLYINNNDFIDWLRALHQYIQKGYTRKGSETSTNNVDEFFIDITQNSTVPMELPRYGRYVDSNGNAAEVYYIVDQNYSTYTTPTSFGTGIAAASKNKEKAFDFITRIFTEEKLTNLLLYGIEGLDYTLTDGKLPRDTDYGRYNIVYGNSLIAKPLYFESINKKEEYFSFYNNAIPTKYAGITLDLSNVADEIKATNNVMAKLKLMYQKDIPDFELFISQIREELENAGVSRILDEVNKQLADY